MSNAIQMDFKHVGPSPVRSSRAAETAGRPAATRDHPVFLERRRTDSAKDNISFGLIDVAFVVVGWALVCTNTGSVLIQVAASIARGAIERNR